MSGRLTEIASCLSTLLQTITVKNGYGYDFGSVNQPDQAKSTEPSALITYTDESAVSEPSAYYGYALANFTIQLTYEMSKTETVPFYAVDALLDTLLRDVKQVLLRSSTPHTLPLNFGNVIMYNGFTKETFTRGDIFQPKGLNTRWSVRYQENILETSP